MMACHLAVSVPLHVCLTPRVCVCAEHRGRSGGPDEEAGGLREPPHRSGRADEGARRHGRPADRSGTLREADVSIGHSESEFNFFSIYN